MYKGNDGSSIGTNVAVKCLMQMYVALCETL